MALKGRSVWRRCGAATHGFHSSCFKAARQWQLLKLTTSSSQVGAGVLLLWSPVLTQQVLPARGVNGL
jgi:hypothetical protein